MNSIDAIYLGGATVPLNPALVQYVRANDTHVIWENQLTAGFGWQVQPDLRLDAHVGHAFNNDQSFDGTHVDAGAWQTGVGLTWHFDN